MDNLHEAYRGDYFSIGFLTLVMFYTFAQFCLLFVIWNDFTIKYNFCTRCFVLSYSIDKVPTLCYRLTTLYWQQYKISLWNTKKCVWCSKRWSHQRCTLQPILVMIACGLVQLLSFNIYIFLLPNRWVSVCLVIRIITPALKKFDGGITNMIKRLLQKIGVEFS